LGLAADRFFKNALGKTPRKKGQVDGAMEGQRYG
jgi:hypothetical protein